MSRISPRSLRDKITLLDSQVTGTDPYGNDIYGLVDIGTWPASVSVMSHTEDEVRRDTFTNFYKFVVEPNCPVEGVDSVMWGGKVYDVVAEPEDHRTFSGFLHHLEFVGRRHDG